MARTSSYALHLIRESVVTIFTPQAAALGKDFVFEDDDSDDKIWDLEVRIAGPPSQSASRAAQRTHAAI